MNRLFKAGLVLMLVAVVVLFSALGMELATTDPVWLSVERGGIASYGIAGVLLMLGIIKWLNSGSS